MLTQDQIAALRAPFPAEEIHWRAGATNKEGNRALALAYIDARAVMDRLDEVIGPTGWADTYEEWKAGAVKAGIGICNEEWVWKYDGADDTNFEATKGGFSDAFKRAAVKWGIGRYLYQLPRVWVSCRKTGNTVKLLETPSLPDWALPVAHTCEKPEEDPQPVPAEKDVEPTPMVETPQDAPAVETTPDAPQAESAEDTPAEESVEPAEKEDSVEPPPVQEASAPAYWMLANQAIQLGISHTRIRIIAHSANGEGWTGAIARLREEMKLAA